ncbi:MAG: DUF2505 domain-containing protein, partial [Polyangiaceae bacterium]|nr:DUF2505 domain-containing protein [Polyangiaceae bacterium]
MPTVKYTYVQDAETVFRFVSDPEVVRERSVFMGERDIKITKQGDTVTNDRMVDAEVPSFAAKLLKPSNNIIEVKRWNPATKSGTFSVEVKNVPTQLEGTIRITPKGEGSEYAIDFKVTCKIPLIGGKLASYIEGLTQKG